MKLTGSQILIEVLRQQGVDAVFGYPGGTVLNIYDELYKASDTIMHYTTCHEQGAIHAADGYARATGKPGVVIATSGPGATNLITGIATAFLDSIPIVAITGNVACEMIGSDSFQEVDIIGVSMSITKHNYIVKDIAKLADTLTQAFSLAQSGRPGPVLVDIPKDIQTAFFDYQKSDSELLKIKVFDNDSSLQEAVKIIEQSAYPFIYVGGGAVASASSAEIIALAEKLYAPMGATLMGLSAIPQTHELFLGMTGMHGTYEASKAMQESDLIIAVGTRFSDRATGNKKEFSKNKKIIHIDIDQAEINKNIFCDLALIGNIKDVLQQLLNSIHSVKKNNWFGKIELFKAASINNLNSDEEKLTPKKIIRTVGHAANSKCIVATDVGQHQMWTAQYYPFTTPRTFISSGGLGTMGFGMGAAIGACIGSGFQRTILFTSDGSFHMNLNELATAVSNNLPLLIVVLNNNALGMVRQWQTLFFGKRYSNTELNRKTNFSELAKSFGAKGLFVDDYTAFKNAIAFAFEQKGPVLVDVLIDADERVLPMIPPGGTITDAILN